MITEKSSKMQSINDNKIQREVTNLKRNLLHERNLKLDAFQKVDQLQTHLFDLEDEMTNIAQTIRPQTSVVDKVIKSKMIVNFKLDLAIKQFKKRKGALRSNLTSSLNLTTNSKHSSPFPRLPSGVNNLTQSASTASINQ